MEDLIEQFAAAERNPKLAEGIRPTFRYAKIKPTNNCNSKCITCSYWERQHTGELTLQEIQAALADLRAVGTEEVMFTGGEPTLNKDLPQMIATARDLGFSVIGITTNSLSLNDRRIELLLEAGLNEVVLSLEGLTFHDEIRGVGGNTEKVVRNLHLLREHRDSGRYPQLSIKLGMTLMNKNISDVPGMIQLARDNAATLFFNLIDGGTYFFRGIDQNLFDIEDRTGYERQIDDVIAIKRKEPQLIGNSISSLHYAKRYFQDPKQAEIPCYLGYVGCEVDANGDVFSNCWGLPAVGNIRKTPLSEILNSPAYQKRLGAMYRKQCSGCSCGYILNLALHPASAAADRAASPHTGRQGLGYAGERILA